MKAKLKFTETVVEKRTVKKDSMTYSYALLKHESKKLSSFRIPLYAIRIGLTDELGTYTEAQTDELFSDLGKAMVFYDRLIRNLATPIDLAYVVEDEILR